MNMWKDSPSSEGLSMVSEDIQYEYSYKYK